MNFKKKIPPPNLKKKFAIFLATYSQQSKDRIVCCSDQDNRISLSFLYQEKKERKGF